MVEQEEEVEVVVVEDREEWEGLRDGCGETHWRRRAGREGSIGFSGVQ